MKKKNKSTSVISFGIALGTVVVVATKNLGLWLSLGIVFGAAYSAKIKKKQKEEAALKKIKAQKAL